MSAYPEVVQLGSRRGGLRRSHSWAALAGVIVLVAGCRDDTRYACGACPDPYQANLPIPATNAFMNVEVCTGDLPCTHYSGRKLKESDVLLVDRNSGVLIKDLDGATLTATLTIGAGPAAVVQRGTTQLKYEDGGDEPCACDELSHDAFEFRPATDDR